MRWLILLAASAASLLAQTAAPNDSGVSVGHMHLVVADPDAQKKLFVGVLGAQVTNAGSLEMLKFPGVFVVVQKARTAPSEGSDGSTVNHFGFMVKSYADTKAKLTAAGVTSFPLDHPEQKQFIAEFPEKVRVEFTEDAALKTPIAFHHIHIVTTDIDSLRAWYIKTFGAKAGKRGDFPAAMLPGGEVDFRKVDTAPAPTKGRSLDHIGFEIKGLEAFCKNLEAQGVPFDLAYREMPQLGGLKIAFILDPVGTRIELTEGLNAH
ncbi:MAG TPA: VOC family protein [Bryobacteraceae bacterium]|nr:VOC family protein [Bryobacteraceae bacterium]